MNNRANNQISRLLILGNKGFIGRHLEKRFRSCNPETEVLGVGRADVDLTSENDVKKLAEFFDLKTAIVMLSAIKRQFGDNLDAFTQNLKMTVNLCRFLQEQPVGRFVYFSSSAVYGEDIHNTNITEATPVQPTSYYGMVKYISERLYWKALKAHNGSSLLILRPPTIYGPGDEGGTYGPVKFLNAAVKNEELVLWGNGNELREFVYIDAVVEMVFRLIFSAFDGVVNLSCGTSYSFRDVLDAIESISGKKLHIKSRPRTKNKVDNGFSNDNLLKEIGNYTFTPLHQGLETLYKHLISESPSNR